MDVYSSDEEIGPWDVHPPRLKRVKAEKRLKKQGKRVEVRGRQRTDKRTYQAKLLDLMDGVGWLEERTLPTPLCNLHSESPLPRLLTLSPIKRLSPIKPQCSMTPIPPPRSESRLPSLVDAAQGSTVLAGRPMFMEKEEHPVVQALVRRLKRL